MDMNESNINRNRKKAKDFYEQNIEYVICEPTYDIKTND